MVHKSNQWEEIRKNATLHCTPSGYANLESILINMNAFLGLAYILM